MVPPKEHKPHSVCRSFNGIEVINILITKKQGCSQLLGCLEQSKSAFLPASRTIHCLQDLQETLLNPFMSLVNFKVLHIFFAGFHLLQREACHCSHRRLDPSSWCATHQGASPFARNTTTNICGPRCCGSFFSFGEFGPLTLNASEKTTFGPAVFRFRERLFELSEGPISRSAPWAERLRSWGPLKSSSARRAGGLVECRRGASGKRGGWCV